MTEVTGWEDLSGLLPESRGWMHSGVAVLGDGRVLCAHPEGRDLLVIDPSGRAETIPTSLTEMHSIFTCERDGEEVIAVADPGTASSRIPPTRRPTPITSRPGAQ
ncbi:NHL repeat-containing protein [Arthrobacter sp. Hiyo4]|nr:NHL repeat-containing protein [Arthrobacter sp. Hiyo4]